jgi:hypothetical protein
VAHTGRLTLRHLGDGVTWIGGLTLVVLLSGSALPAAAAPPRRDDDGPMVLALAQARSGLGAPAASVLWFVAALGPSAAGSPVAGNHARLAETADFPWVRVMPSPDVAVLVVLVREGADGAALAERLAPLLDQGVREIAGARLDRAQAIARLKKDVSQAIPSAPAGEPRVLGVNELRLTAGDLATARVGLIVKKQIDFSTEQGSYRLQFQLVSALQLVTAPPPSR